MKKKLFGLAAVAAGAIAIVGAGFSAWYFSGTTTLTSSEQSYNTVITQATTSAGTITVNNGVIFVMDQGTAANAGNNNVGVYFLDGSQTYSSADDYDVTYDDKGVASGDYLVTTLTATWSLTDEEYNLLCAKITAGLMKAPETCDVVLAVGVELAKYLDFDTANSTTLNQWEESSEPNTTYIHYDATATVDWDGATPVYEDPNASDEDKVITGYEVTITYTLPTVYYQAGMKPLTFADYQKMVYKLQGASSASGVETKKYYQSQGILGITFNLDVSGLASTSYSLN